MRWQEKWLRGEKVFWDERMREVTGSGVAREEELSDRRGLVKRMPWSRLG